MRNIEELIKLKNKNYYGKLYSDLIEIGISNCLYNVKSLIIDINLLMSNNRFSRSLSLTISALEELGKITILGIINILPENKPNMLKSQWRRFYNHKDKSTGGIINSFSNDTRKDFYNFVNMSLNQKNKSDNLETIRQFGIYTDYFSNEQLWISPDLIVNENYFLIYYNKLIKSFNRINSFNNIGLYKKQSLEIAENIYKKVFNLFPDKDLSYKETKENKQILVNIAKEYYAELIKSDCIKKEDLSFIID